MLARIYNFEEINEDGFKIRELSLLNGSANMIALTLRDAVAENSLRKALAVVDDNNAAWVLGDALIRLRIEFVSVYAGDGVNTQQRKVDEAINAHGRFVLIVCDELFFPTK